MKFKVEPEKIVRQRLFKAEKRNLAYKLAGLIYQAAVEVVGKRAVKPEDVVLEHPANPEHGDYSTNIAMVLFSRGIKSASQVSSRIVLADSEFQKKKKTTASSTSERPKFRPGVAGWNASGSHASSEVSGFGTPLDLANQIVNAWRSQGLPDFIAKIEVAKPGFINLWLSQDWFVSRLQRVLEEKDGFGKLTILKGRKILLEHTSPNPQTTIMLGHLRNNFLGISMANILEFLGAKVTKDCIVNDRGVHLCRAIWGYLVFGRKRSGLKKAELLRFKKISDKQIGMAIAKADWRQSVGEWTKKKSDWWQPKELGLKPDHANLIWYVLGSQAYKLSEEVKKQVEEILVAWEAEDKDVWQIWRRILDWSDKGYQQTYARVGSVHDWTWRESDHYQKGKEIVKQGLKKGIFRKSEGAVVTDLTKFNLPDTVVVKKDGTALYITQDLALTKFKSRQFPSDLYIWDIGEEQTLYFQQLFAVCEQLGIVRREKLFHFSCALINFKGGKKMSTRRGDVVMADEILDELHRRATEIIKSSNQALRGKLSQKQLDQLAEAVGVGAIKYSLLKFSRETTIQFDIDESLALEGNSGPYLQYTYARCQSVLSKASIKDTPLLRTVLVETEEFSLLRTLYRFPEIVHEAGENFAPNLLCNFLFDLAQKYNLFYHKQPILKAETEELRNFRLAITVAVGQILKNGLNLLGISTPERM